MDTFSWAPGWPWLIVTLSLAVVATLVDGRSRLGAWRRPPSSGRRRRSVASSSGEATPEPGDVWWVEASPPAAPDTAARLYLVLGRHGDTAQVAPLTPPRDHSAVVALPPGTVHGDHERPHAVDTADPGVVPLRDFRRRAGRVDPDTWKRLRAH